MIEIKTLGGRVLSGQRYALLTTVERAGSTSTGQALWHCDCDCGGTAIVKAGHLRSGNTRSCGCMARRALTRRNEKHGHARRGAKSPEYRTWEAMIRRCHLPAHAAYRYYGAKGVRVCGEWRESFAAFLAHVGPKPSAEHSIDRIDPFGDYCPGSVRWATRAEQAANRREAHIGYQKAVQS